MHSAGHGITLSADVEFPSCPEVSETLIPVKHVNRKMLEICRQNESHVCFLDRVLLASKLLNRTRRNFFRA